MLAKLYMEDISLSMAMKAVEKYKKNGYVFIKDDCNENVKCALLERDGSIIFLVEHNA